MNLLQLPVSAAWRAMSEQRFLGCKDFKISLARSG